MLSAVRFFEIYTAINLHFKQGSKYDFFKYAGKARVSEKSFSVRKDKYFFEKFASKFLNEESAIGFIVSNRRNGCKHITQYDMDTYLVNWLRWKESLYHLFECEFQNFQSLKLTHQKGDTPLLVELGINNTLSTEFIILLDIAYNGKIFEALDQTGNFLWEEELKQKCNLYRPFITNYWELNEEKIGILKGVITKNV